MKYEKIEQNRGQLAEELLTIMTHELRNYLTNQIALAHQGTLTVNLPDHDETWLTLALPVEDEELEVRDRVE